MTDTVISRLRPSMARRVLAAGANGALGLMILWLVAMTSGRAPMLMLVLLILGALSIGFAVLVWRATAKGLVLTSAGLQEEETGRVLFRLEDVDKIERGLLHWKPAGGFAVVTSKPLGRAWVPGLWWRAGRRVMIGGATNGGEAKAMADLMRAEITRQQG